LARLYFLDFYHDFIVIPLPLRELTPEEKRTAEVMAQGIVIPLKTAFTRKNLSNTFYAIHHGVLLMRLNKDSSN
jgi:hypothetical protein